MRYSLLIFCVLAMLGLGCSKKKIRSSQEYLAWLSNVDNGCKVSKRINDIIISVKYLPPAFLALKEAELNHKPDSYDSLYQSYANSVTFVMSFNTKEGEAGEDVMYKDISNYKEYLERSLTLNFDLESKVSLKTASALHYPVLSSLENTYGLSKGRDVNLVFSSKEKAINLFNEPVWDVIYNDDIYNIGIVHFPFNIKDITKKLPQLELKKSS